MKEKNKLVIDDSYAISRKKGNGVITRKVWVDKNGEVIKYALAYVNYNIMHNDSGRVLGYDNSHGYHHKHIMGEIIPVKFISFEETEEQFEKEFEEIHYEYTKKPDLDISARNKEDFFKRGRDIAKKLDQKKPLEDPSKNIWFEDPDDLMQFLSKNKFELINVLRKSPHTMTELVEILKRNRSAIEKDLKVLLMFGLVECELKSNPGHGRVKVAKATYNKPVILQIRF